MPCASVFPWPWVGVRACWGPTSPQRERPLAADDLRTVQTSLLGLAREFLVRSSSADDMQVVLNFLAASGDDGQVGWNLVTGRLGGGVECGPRGEAQPSVSPCLPKVLGVLDLLLALLQGSSTQESLAVFLLGPGSLEVLLALLVQPRSLPLLSNRVCQVQQPTQPRHPIGCGPCLRSRQAQQALGWQRKPPLQAFLGITRLCGDCPSHGNLSPVMTPLTLRTQILRRLQQNERLPERSRQRLWLRECGLQGLVAFLPEAAVSLQLCQDLYKLFLGTGTTWLGQKGRPGRGVIGIQEEGRWE